MSTTHALSDLESKASSRTAFTRAEADRVVSCPDLVSVGVLGAASRKALHGSRVTYGRVAIVQAGVAPAERGESGEVRIVGVPTTPEQAIEWTRAAAAWAGPSATLTGFALHDLDRVAGHDHIVLCELARALQATGLSGVAEIAIDQMGEDPGEVVRAVLHGGLFTKRATVTSAPFGTRLDLIERVVALQKDTKALSAFAPLPRVDPPEAPSTGYDDVKTIVAARLMATSIPHIQVDWALYGPKLAQVAIEYGADDIDAVSAVDIERMGTRRSPKQDIERQIRSAFAEPAERTGRYEFTA